MRERTTTEAHVRIMSILWASSSRIWDHLTRTVRQDVYDWASADVQEKEEVKNLVWGMVIWDTRIAVRECTRVQADNSWFSSRLEYWLLDATAVRVNDLWLDTPVRVRSDVMWRKARSKIRQRVDDRAWLGLWECMQVEVTKQTRDMVSAQTSVPGVDLVADGIPVEESQK
jgi:hypothetical protein